MHTHVPQGHLTFFFEVYRDIRMDASKLIEKRMLAANTYRSNWQARDASEITMRKVQMSQKANSSTHHGPSVECCSDGRPKVSRSTSPTNGYATTFSEEIVFQRKAGCANCNDPNFGKAGGVVLQSCEAVACILEREANPVKGVSCYCADPGIKRQPFPADCSIIQPAYTGSRNQVPITASERYGHLPKQQYPYPSS
jgi:hypothetical protein